MVPLTQLNLNNSLRSPCHSQALDQLQLKTPLKRDFGENNQSDQRVTLSYITNECELGRCYLTSFKTMVHQLL